MMTPWDYIVKRNKNNEINKYFSSNIFWPCDESGRAVYDSVKNKNGSKTCFYGFSSSGRESVYGPVCVKCHYDKNGHVDEANIILTTKNASPFITRNASGDQRWRVGKNEVGDMIPFKELDVYLQDNYLKDYCEYFYKRFEYSSAIDFFNDLKKLVKYCTEYIEYLFDLDEESQKSTNNYIQQQQEEVISESESDDE